MRDTLVAVLLVGGCYCALILTLRAIDRRVDRNRKEARNADEA